MLEQLKRKADAEGKKEEKTERETDTFKRKELLAKTKIEKRLKKRIIGMVQH